MFNLKSLITIVTLTTISLLIAGVAKIHLDGQSSLNNDIVDRDLQSHAHLSFINYSSELKSYFLSIYPNRLLHDQKKEAYLKTKKTLQNTLLGPHISFHEIDKLEADFQVLQFKRLETLKAMSSKEKELSTNWEKLFQALEVKIAKRIKKKQDFLPGLKDRLSQWSKSLPVLKDLKNSLDVSYVQKGKLEEIQSIIDFIQWIITTRNSLKESLISRKDFLNRLDRTLLNEVEKTEIKLYFGEILKTRKQFANTKDTHKGISLRMEAIKERVNEVLKKVLLPSWQNFSININHAELQKKSQTQKRILEISVILAISIILILFLYSLRIRREEKEKEALNNSLQKMKRLSERGEFAAKMAHEIKNPLSILTYCLSDAQENLNKGEISQSKEELDKSLEALERLKSVAKNLSTHSSHSTLQSLNLISLLKDLKRQYSSWCEEEDITIVIESTLKEAIIQGPYLEILGAFSNLLDNAIEHIRTQSPSERTITITLTQEKGQFTLLFQNAGKKIPKPNELFNNFYTTKEGSDRGLGLPIVKDIVTKMGGEVSYSFSNSQNTFKVSLPS